MARTRQRREPARALGLRIEGRVARYLERQGLELVASNISSRHGEVDLVMLDGASLVFVEVRYRGPRSRVSACQTVDQHKQRRIQSVAAHFLSRHPEHYDRVCRFDVVGVNRTFAGRLRIDWLRDAFRKP